MASSLITTFGGMMSAGTERARAERAFREALVAYDKASLQDDDKDAALLALANAIQWACTLDEHHARADSTYESRRGADAEGKLLPGVRYARDRIVHQIADVLDLVDGAAFPMVLDAPLWEYTWRAVAKLPAADATFENRKSTQVKRALYQAELVEVPVRFTLESVAAWFGRVP